MKKLFGLCLFAISLFSCTKDKAKQPGDDIQKLYAANAARVTITDGIWGTVTSTEGDCMPAVQPSNSTCKIYPVKRTIKIYQYTTLSQATPSGNSPVFFDSFSTQLVAEVESDANGFYELNIPPGHYTGVIVENGKLYANGGDGQGGINPITYSGGRQNVNLSMTYKAAF